MWACKKKLKHRASFRTHCVSTFGYSSKLVEGWDVRKFVSKMPDSTEA